MSRPRSTTRGAALRGTGAVAVAVAVASAHFLHAHAFSAAPRSVPVMAGQWAAGGAVGALRRKHRSHRTLLACANGAVKEDESLQEGLARSAWEGRAPAIEAFGMQIVHKSPPMFRIPNFLTPGECDALIAAAIENSEEATEYLNARVNSEVTGASSIPQLATGYSQEASDEAVEWSGGATSGLRRRLPREALRMLDERVLSMLGEVATGRELNMVLDQIYIRPDERTVIVRDATVVHYKEGEGVAPHVDGKDATLLCYLNDLPAGAGGRTVFPEVKVASTPRRGDALLYDSRKDLLHFAEPVAKGHEKWVMQLLIDFKFVKQAGGMHVDFRTGSVSLHACRSVHNLQLG
jgi:hypothetical protein